MIKNPDKNKENFKATGGSYLKCLFFFLNAQLSKIYKECDMLSDKKITKL